MPRDILPLLWLNSSARSITGLLCIAALATGGLRAQVAPAVPATKPAAPTTAQEEALVLSRIHAIGVRI